MKNNRKLDILARLLPLLVVSLCTASAMGQTLSPGDPAPKLEVGKWLKGEPVSNLEPGKVYVVELWATWCGPCKVSIPKLTNLAKEYAGKVTFVGVSVMEQDTANVEPYVKQMGDQMDYDVAIDQQSNATAGSGFMAKNWMQASGVTGIPAAFVVGKTGRIEFIGLPGDLEKDNVLDKVLAGKWDAKAYVAAKKAAAEAQQKAATEAWLKTPMGAEWKKMNDFWRAKQYSDALRELDVMAALPPDSRVPKPADYVRGAKYALYAQMGDMDAYYRHAESDFERLNEMKGDGGGLGKTFEMNIIAWQIADPQSKLPRKDWDFAIKVVKRAIELDREKAKAHYAENPDMYKGYMEGNAEYLDTLAWAYYGKGEKLKAVGAEKEALRLATTYKNEGDAQGYRDTIKKLEQ